MLRMDHPAVIAATEARHERLRHVSEASILFFGKANWYDLTEAQKSVFLHDLQTGLV